MRRLTEKNLAKALEKHAASCEACTRWHQCEEADRIEASFWNEVDARIDDDIIERRKR